jgi:hypothetical protein
MVSEYRLGGSSRAGAISLRIHKMLCNGWPKGPQIPLSQDAIARLHERANELRQMAASTDEPRLHRLADRYGKVAMRRSLSVADRQCLVEARREEIESRTAYSVPGRPPYQAPTPAALAMAAHAIGASLSLPTPAQIPRSVQPSSSWPT